MIGAPGRYAGKTVLVIGGTKGIGRVTCEKFASEGANVMIGDIDPAVTDTVAELAVAFPEVGVSGDVMNVTIEEDCRRIVDATIRAFGAIDTLVVTSGILNVPAEVSELPLAEWNRVFAVNVTGPFLMGKAIAGHLKERHSGQIVNVGSFWGRDGQAFFSAYCASKAAVLMLTQSQAAELAPFGVRVNSVAPGMTNTEMHQKALVEEAEKRGVTLEEWRAHEYADIPLGTSGDPMDIANAVFFLASDESKYMTGASLDVNGGVLFR